MHLFPHVEFPGHIWISVIFLTGLAVELSLNDLLLNRQLSGHWKHTFTHTSLILFFSPFILMSDLQNAPEGGARFVFEPGGPVGPDLTVLETLSPASSLWNADAFFWLWDTKMLGIIWACVSCMCVCVWYDRCVYRFWWACHLIFEDLHGFVMRVRLLYKRPSITFPTHGDRKQNKNLK